MSDFTPTPEQNTCITLAAEKAHLMIEARAGAAKTTTLELISNSEYGKTVNGLCLAFNKKIAEEMAAKLPSNFTCKTLNALGLNIWWEYTRQRTNVDKGKVYRLLNTELQKIEDSEERQLYFEDLNILLDAIRASKAMGYVWGTENDPKCRNLISEEDFFLSLEVALSPDYQSLVNLITNRSYKEMFKGILDFDDMLLGPAICKCSFPSYNLIMVDEAQDLSPINHSMLEKLVKRKTQLIAVGDPCQAIYGFRGADEYSMLHLKQQFEMQTTYLTTSFRCSKNVLKQALWRAPDMVSPEWAKEGNVYHHDNWDESYIPDNAVVICRNNAPLFNLALRLLADGRYPELAGRDLIKSLVATMKKLGSTKINREQALANLETWFEKESKRQRDKVKLKDRVDCIKIFLEQSETLKDAIELAKALSTQSGRIKLMTGHKAKGLEFDTVFFLDSDLCKIDRDQDANIKYVIQTRAKRDLHYVSSHCYVKKNSAVHTE